MVQELTQPDRESGQPLLVARCEGPCPALSSSRPMARDKQTTGAQHRAAPFQLRLAPKSIGDPRAGRIPSFDRAGRR